MICGSGGSKSRLAKAAGAEPCGQMRDEQLHADVARSTFPSQNAQKTTTSDHFWKLWCRKSARRCGAKHVSKSKVLKVTVSEHFWKLRRRKNVRHRSKRTKHTRFGPLLEVEMSKKGTPLWHEAHVQVKMLKAPHARTTFTGSDVVSRGRRKGFCALSKLSKTWGFCSISKNNGRCGTFEEDLQRCMSRGRRSTRDMSIRDVRRSGHWFLRGVAFCSIRSSVLGRWFCVTGAGLRIFLWQAQYFRQVEWNNCKTHWYEAVSSALNF